MQTISEEDDGLEEREREKRSGRKERIPTPFLAPLSVVFTSPSGTLILEVPFTIFLELLVEWHCFWESLSFLTFFPIRVDRIFGI